ncbi:hypothetical protein EBV26_07445 [bacterium]|nr:hypothetical protein [bacterium]
MTVNPNLAALMRVIEDNQDNMPEGEYLEAMNALGALHRQIPAAAAVAAAEVQAALLLALLHPMRRRLHSFNSTTTDFLLEWASSNTPHGVASNITIPNTSGFPPKIGWRFPKTTETDSSVKQPRCPSIASNKVATTLTLKNAPSWQDTLWACGIRDSIHGNVYADTKASVKTGKNTNKANVTKTGPNIAPSAAEKLKT